MKHIPYRQNPTVIDISKKPVHRRGNSTHEYELSNQLNTAYNSFAPVCIFADGRFVFSAKFFQKVSQNHRPILSFAVLRVYERGHQKKSPAFAAAKGGENMNEPNRTQWQIRCAFNGFCKQALKREAMNAHRDTKRQQLREVTFSDPVAGGRKQLYLLRQIFCR